MYEGNEILPWALNRLKNGGVYVDSGANIGQWLLFFGELPGTKMIAFEPVSSKRSWLHACLGIQQNWNCTVLPFGLADMAKKVDMQIWGPRSTLNMEWYEGKKLEVQSIQVRRLDDALSETGIESVDLWKLDVEGAEYDALVGAEAHLDGQTIKAIVFECHSDNFTKIRDYLRPKKYVI